EKGKELLGRAPYGGAGERCPRRARSLPAPLASGKNQLLSGDRRLSPRGSSGRLRAEIWPVGSPRRRGSRDFSISPPRPRREPPGSTRPLRTGRPPPGGAPPPAVRPRAFRLPAR